MPVHTSEVLVIGSGVAGLNAALTSTALGRVHLVTKKEDYESNTNYAQGGIASVLDQHDSFDAHVRDTLDAGAGLCHREAVELIVKNGPQAIEALLDIGVAFTRKTDGSLELGREGGHSYRRIVHAKDLTGREVERSLLAQVRAHRSIDLFQYFFAVDLVQDDTGRCWGAWVWDEHGHEVHLFLASITLLCTGGCGQVYKHTTNPIIATGDGVAMGFRAGAPVANMEFIQFHPTAFYQAHAKEPPFLISEAVRGEGAVLRNKNGEAFMERYHPQKDLAPRDIVARAIDQEMKERGEPCAFLDVSHMGVEFFRERFPTISAYCETQGVDVSRDSIPVIPAAHYVCGGVITDLHGATPIAGLFVIGEAACTGVHGANRLASNSILEALIFSQRVIEHVREQGMLDPVPRHLAHEWEWHIPPKPIEAVRLIHCRQTLTTIMSDYVGIVRSDERLRRAHKRVLVLREEIESVFVEGNLSAAMLELRNLALLADVIIRCAMQRHESRGLHFTLDHPERDEIPRDTVICKRGDNEPSIESVAIPGAGL